MDWLATWIRPRHLEPAALGRSRRSFESEAGPFVVLEDFLLEPTAREVAAFLGDEAAFRRSFGLYRSDDESREEEWRAAEEKDRFYAYHVLEEGQWQGPLSSGARSYLRLRRAFADPRFAAFCHEATGLPLSDEGIEVGTHAMRRGDFLKHHRDLGHDRRLAFLLYLSPGWRESFGGVLRLIDREGDETSIVPACNRLLLFDVVANRGHYVTPITAPEGARISVGGWVHQAADA